MARASKVNSVFLIHFDTQDWNLLENEPHNVTKLDLTTYWIASRKIEQATIVVIVSACR